MGDVEREPKRVSARRPVAAVSAAVVVLALAVTAGVLFGPGAPRHVPKVPQAQWPRDGRSEPPGSAHEQAVRRAGFIVDTAPMVPGAVRRTSAPDKMLSQPASVPGAQHVQRTRFWTAAGTVAATIAYLQQHPPAGMTQSGSGSAGGPGVPRNASLDFQADAFRSLNYNVIAYQHGVAVRADAQVLWAPRRDPADTVPSSITAVDVLVVRTNPQMHQGAPTVHRTLTGSAAHALVAFVNRLPRAVPTFYTGCPADLGGERWFDRLVFHGPGTSSRLVVNMVGCSTATLRVGDRKAIALSSSFSAAVDNIDHEITRSIGLPQNYGH